MKLASMAEKQWVKFVPIRKAKHFRLLVNTKEKKRTIVDVDFNKVWHIILEFYAVR